MYMQNASKFVSMKNTTDAVYIDIPIYTHTHIHTHTYIHTERYRLSLRRRTNQIVPYPPRLGNG
jgi:hypothetical protein